jgi:hypothetical protein
MDPWRGDDVVETTCVMMTLQRPLICRLHGRGWWYDACMIETAIVDNDSTQDLIDWLLVKIIKSLYFDTKVDVRQKKIWRWRNKLRRKGKKMRKRC